MGDAICKIYGIVDLTAALIIYFSDLPIPVAIKLVLAFIMIFKGVPSLV